MSVPDHLTDDLLIRALDDELSGGDAIRAESHLAVCEACRKRHHNLRVVSDGIEALAAENVWRAPGEREALITALENRPAVRPVTVDSIRSFTWVLALAAGLAIAILAVPRWMHSPTAEKTMAIAALQPATLEVDGETFIPLPYSNPDLPMTAPHIVQMQVPVSSLATAGIVLEPVSAGAEPSEQTVLADVLVGMDGQPLGVHVLSFE